MHDWEQRKLGELAEILRGASPRPIQSSQWFNENSEVGWLRISDVTEQNGRIHYLEQKLSKLGEAKTRVLLEPHLLLSIAATVGKPVINYVKTGVHDGFLIFYKPNFNKEFMFQWLEMYRPKWQKYGQPGSQVNLNSKLVKAQDILIPDIEEQKIISTFLNNIELLLTLHQRKLEQLEKLKQALLQQMFPQKDENVPRLRFANFDDNWEQNKLNDISDMYDNLRVPVTASDRVAGDTPYYGANGIQDYVRGYTHMGEYVLIAEDGANDLVNYPVHYVTGKVWINNHAHVIRGIEGKLNNLFLVSRLKSMNLIPWLVGGGRAKLNGDVLKKLPLLIPYSEEQQKIGAYFKYFDDIITLHRKNLEDLGLIKQSLLQDLFI
ncbi:restriction endonuclease subunit S [Aerococcus viridans]